MAQQNEKQPKAKTGLARCLELASGHKGLVFLAGFLAALAAICSFVPYLSIYYIIREILFVYPDMSLLNVSTISTWGWLALAGILGNIVFYFFALLCSHVAAFGTLYELKVAFADHIMQIPLGYHLTLGSGKMRKIMDENIESVEKFIAHQLPDFVASLVAPLVLVIILLGIDWRYGVVCLVGIVLAFIVQFAGFNGEAKEKMHRFQTAQENMNSASVEYVRGMSEIKAFNQTADSFKRLSKSITDYTSFVLEYALGWQNCMPAFTTIINNIYLLLIPVGVLIGMHTTDFREYSLTFIFYLIIVHAISGVLNKIMYISESFTQIDGSVERMDEILRIPVLPEKSTAATIENYGIAFRDVSFSYEADSQVKALSHVSFFADQGKVTAIVGPSGGGKSTIASLISRFYDVTDGSIQIGGVDIRDIPLDALMDKVRNIQDCSFSGSLPDVFNNSPAQADSIQTLTEIRDGDLYFCLEGRTVCIRDQEIDLTAKEFDALHLLIINRRRVLTFETIAYHVWDEDYIDVTAQAIHNLMSRLRQKFQISPDVPEYVTSVRGVGYKFNSQKVNNKK